VRLVVLSFDRGDTGNVLNAYLLLDWLATTEQLVPNVWRRKPMRKWEWDDWIDAEE